MNQPDQFFMLRALSLAESVKGSTSPNPAVGAVIVKDGEIIGEGATSPAGGDHAEIVAIKSIKSGESAKGATLYVTLEPCSHWGRTPPCSKRVVEEGFSRVVIAVEDPNPLVSGRGIEEISSASIDITIGVCSSEAKRLNEDFFYTVSTGKAWVTLKLAMTLDGYIADSFGGSKWITSSESRAEVHRLRETHNAIAVGGATLRADNPKLTARGGSGRDPIRVLFSRSSDIDRDSYFWRSAREVPTYVVISDRSLARFEELECGIKLLYTGISDSSDSLSYFVEMAPSIGIHSLLLEGGGGLAGAFLEASLVNRATLFYGPKILGGGISGCRFEPRRLADSINLIDCEYKQFGSDWMVSGLVERA